MAVFVAYSDESDVGDLDGMFLYAGYAAPEKDWPELSESWDNRVLSGPPRIPYLHMTEIKRLAWRNTHRISYNDAENRIDEAVRIIFSRGSLLSVGSCMRKGDLREAVYKPLKVAKVQPLYGVKEPDYLSFLAYAANAIDQVYGHYPDAEKVNFVVSRKKKVSEHVRDFHEMLKAILAPPLSALVGDLIPGDMERTLPLQFADVSCWHMQRYFAKTMERVDESRLWYLGEKNGRLQEITREELEDIGRRLVSATGGNARMA